MAVLGTVSQYFRKLENQMVRLTKETPLAGRCFANGNTQRNATFAFGASEDDSYYLVWLHAVSRTAGTRSLYIRKLEVTVLDTEREDRQGTGHIAFVSICRMSLWWVVNV